MAKKASAGTAKRATKSGAKKDSLASVKRAARRALCVGINDYPYDGSDLNGCVNDARAWAELLIGKYGFAATDVKIILDQEATRKNMLDALKDLLAGAQTGDTIVFTNSSHGSYVLDTDGDESKFDEILCPYDIADNHIVDDELRNLIGDVKDGVNLTVVLDNCFSGTATRAIPDMPTPDNRRRRFLSPALRGLPIAPNPFKVQALSKAMSKDKYPESKMREVLLTGCSDKEYSYDAYFDGVYHGAMTYYAMQAIKEAHYNLTYAQLHARIRNLISDYPQTPQLEGNTANKKKQIFG
jgi:hypothetical protein